MTRLKKQDINPSASRACQLPWVAYGAAALPLAPLPLPMSSAVIKVVVEENTPCTKLKACVIPSLTHCDGVHERIIAILYFVGKSLSELGGNTPLGTLVIGRYILAGKARHRKRRERTSGSSARHQEPEMSMSFVRFSRFGACEIRRKFVGT